MGFGKKRMRLGDGGPSEIKRAFSGQGSGDDAGDSVTSYEPETQARNPHFLTDAPSFGNESLSRLNSDASTISTVADCRNADSLSRCTSLSPIEWADAWEQPSADTECVNSEETWKWTSSFSDLRSEVTESGQNALAGSSDSNFREQTSSSKMRRNRSDNDRQVVHRWKDIEGRAGDSERSYVGYSARQTNDGSFPRNYAVDTSSDLQESDEATEEEQVHSPIGPSSEENAFSGESKDDAQCPSYVHSSGRRSLEERTRLGERPSTIDHDFEDYFSALLL